MKCQLCKSPTLRYTGIKKGVYKLLVCNNCGLFFINPFPSKIRLNKYYNYYLQEKGYKYLNEDLRKYKIRTVWQSRYNLLKRFIKTPDKKSFLEIGSGVGEWLETLKNNGVNNFTGLEVAHDEYQILRKEYTNKVYYKSLIGFSPHKKFDVICLWDVLEHFTEIDKAMNKLKKLLKNNGLIIVSTINTNSISFSLKGACWRYFCPPEHIFYFNQKSIKYLADQYKFRLVYLKSQIQLQALLSSSANKIEKKRLSLNLYKLKHVLDKILSLFLPNKGEIIIFVLKKEK